MNKLGISKIEVLIVAAVVGLLGVGAVLAVSSARSQMRDAVRLSDVRQTQAALELYFNESNGYPESFDAFALGIAATSCLNENGFSASCTPSLESVYMERVSATPSQGLKGLVSCTNESNAYCYFGAGTEFRIQFELETNHNAIGLVKGVNCATETEVVSGSCDALSLTAPEPEAEEGEE